MFQIYYQNMCIILKENQMNIKYPKTFLKGHNLCFHYLIFFNIGNFYSFFIHLFYINIYIIIYCDIFLGHKNFMLTCEKYYP
jgi:hypothetical protein